MTSTPDIIAHNSEQARTLPLRALDFQTLEWGDSVRQLHVGEVLVALVKHGTSKHTFFRLDVIAHLAHIEAVYARSGSASSITLYGMLANKG